MIQPCQQIQRARVRIRKTYKRLGNFLFQTFIEKLICLINQKNFFFFLNRFTIYKVHKASKKKREKSSAKKERKATKTLAIVLGKNHILRSICCNNYE